MAYDNPQGLIAATVILQILAALFVGARFLARRKKKASLSTDDWLIVASLVGSIGLSVMQIWGLASGVLGVPLNIALENPMAVGGRVNMAKHIELATIAVGVPTLGLMRLSVSFLYKRIFTQPTFRWILWTWIGLLILWTVAFELAGLLECGAYLKALFGTPQTYLHHCGSAIPAGYAMVGSSVLSDLITVVLPIPMIWSLQMSTSKKMLIILTFSIALLSVGAGIGKAYIFVTSSIGINSLDGILTITGFSVWNLIEVHVGIMAACAIVMRPILREVFPTDSLTNLAQAFNQLRQGKSTSTRARSKEGHFRDFADDNESDKNEIRVQKQITVTQTK